ncbi:MAG: DedA family protein [Alphaproteobacteria bacterium]|nr:DedA family protein [Alphaproteobacteria bacterium]
MEINRLIAEHGVYFYLTAFIWTFLEGETFVLFAAFAAAQGLLNPVLLLAVTLLGSFSGDQTYFWIGRSFGLRLLNRFPRWRYGVASALYWLERYNTGFILSFRFIYGVRNFSSFAMGMSAVCWKRFLTLNFLAACIWAGGFVAVGYFLGHAFRRVLGDLVRSFSLVMLAVFIVFALAVWLVHRIQKRRQLRVPSAASRSLSQRLEFGASSD